MTDQELREMDAEVHRAVFGIPVVGEAYCWAPDGCWGVCLEVDPGESGGYELRPVYAEHPDDPWAKQPDYYRRPTLNGFTDLALMPVPWYSTDVGDAWDVVCEMIRRFDRDPFICENVYLSGDREWHVVFNGKYEAVEATPMLAICKAALAAARR